MSGHLNQDDIKQLLLLVKPQLESLEIDYWLGRGVLRQQYLTGQVGDRQSDLDVHIWAEDRDKVREKLTPIFSSLNFNENNNEPYKLAYANDENHRIVEFMLLFKDGDTVYHTRKNGVHLECPRECFETTDAKIEVAGVQFNAPAPIEDYLEGVYGSVSTS